MNMKGRDLISVKDLSREEIELIFTTADTLKSETREEGMRRLPGRSLAMIFQKPSTRTRVSFEVGISQLGGHGLFLTANDLQLHRGETLADTARVLSRYVDCIMIRTYDHQDALDLAEYADVPVINGLTDLLHPCQALADFYTVRCKAGSFSGLIFTYVGDGNNVANSLMITAASLGVNIRLATPRGFEPDAGIVSIARDIAASTGASIEISNDAMAAAEGCNVLYTDVWASMGQEEEALLRRGVFHDYQINDKMLEVAASDVMVMHCLPAHRGEEIADSVIDGPRSVIFDEAENRLHVQKAIMALVIK